MHFYNGLDAAKRIGISYKTLLRWKEKGKIIAEKSKTSTGQLVFSEDQVETLRLEVQRERDMFRVSQAVSPGNRQDMAERDSLPLTDTTLNETVKELGKLQARVDVQDARIAELERRVSELESHPQPVTESPILSQPVPPVPPDLPPGTLSARDFAAQLNIKYTVFEGMMRHGVRGEELERTKVPIPHRPGTFSNYFSPEEQAKARALLRKHGKL